MSDNVENVEDTVIGVDKSGGDWFVIHVLSGHEMKVRNSMLKSMALETEELPIYEILIPQEEVAEVRRGKKTTRNKKFFPGYILMRMALYGDGGAVNSEVWHFINQINGVIGFLGGDRPAPLTASEVKDIMDQVAGNEEAAKPKIEFEIGETVNIKDGAFANFEGAVESIDPDRGKVKLMVNIFGRSTPVELEYWQVERQ